jgi:hypothetical protein
MIVQSKIQLLVLLLAAILFASFDKYGLEEFSRLISSDGLVPVSHFLLRFYLLCVCFCLYSDTQRESWTCIAQCLVGVCCGIWGHANQLLAHPEDAAYLPRSLFTVAFSSINMYM